MNTGTDHLPRARLGIAVILALLCLFPRPGYTLALGPHDDGTSNSCKRCHDTASGSPALKGWVPPPGFNPRLGFRTGLCLNCHRWGSPAGASPMLRLACDAGAHGFSVGMVWTPDSWMGKMQKRKEPYIQTGLPYTGTQKLECTSCHKIHFVTNRPFNQRSDIETLCKDCHQGRENKGKVGNENGNGPLPSPGYSTHPTGVTVVDLPGNGPTAFGKVDPMLTVTVASLDWKDRWVLGGHLVDPTSGDAAVTPFSCQTCHAVHGSAERPGQHGAGLPAIYESDNPSALCLGCHRIAGGHPTNGVTGGPFTPAAFVSAQGIPQAWGAGQHYDGGATPFDPATGVAPACTSCHDVHGGLPSTSLLYGPNTVGDGAGNWCFNCHPARALLPAGHKPHGDEAKGAAPECEQCHRDGGEARRLSWKAHNGFGDHRPAR